MLALAPFLGAGPALAAASTTQGSPAMVPASWVVLSAIASALALAILWWVTRRTGLHWVERLHAKTAMIAQGNVPDSSGFGNAPTEVRALAALLRDLGNGIRERDESLQDALRQQRTLVLEMHHRVRNNLQVIASFLSVQIEALPEGGDRYAIDRARLRVAALSLVHRLMFDEGELTTVSTGALFRPLCRMLSEHPGIAGRFDVDCQVEDFPVRIDAAVPLTLWLVEASESLAARGAEGPGARMTVALATTATAVKVAVEASGLGVRAVPDPIADRLTSAIARQLGGEVDREEPAPGMEAIRLQLPLRFGGLPPILVSSDVAASTGADAKCVAGQ